MECEKSASSPVGDLRSITDRLAESLIESAMVYMRLANVEAAHAIIEWCLALQPANHRALILAPYCAQMLCSRSHEVLSAFQPPNVEHGEVWGGEMHERWGRL